VNTINTLENLTHPDFVNLVNGYKTDERITLIEREYAVASLVSVGSIFCSEAFDSYEAIILGGSYSRTDKVPRFKTIANRVESESDFDVMLFYKRNFVLRSISDFISSKGAFPAIPSLRLHFNRSQKKAERVARNLLIDENILNKLSVHVLPGERGLLTEFDYSMYLSFLQGGTLIRGGIRDERLSQEYGRYRNGGISEIRFHPYY
jgi:hypothetical protein